MTFFRLLGVSGAGFQVEKFLDHTNQQLAKQEVWRQEREDGLHDIQLFKVCLIFGSRWMRGYVIRALRSRTMVLDFAAALAARGVNHRDDTPTPWVAGDNNVISYIKEIPVHGRQRPTPVVVMAEEE